MSIINFFKRLSSNASFKVLAVNAIIAIGGILIYAFSLRWTLGYNEKQFQDTLTIMFIVAPVMASILLALIYFKLRPFQRHICRLQDGLPFDEKLYHKARRVSLSLTRVLILFNVIGFFLGPNLGYLLSDNPFNLSSFLGHLKNVALCTSMGFVTGIFAVFISNILIAKDKLLLKMTQIHNERNERDLKMGTKALVMVVSIFLVSYIFTLMAGYHESKKSTKLITALEKPVLTEAEKKAVLEDAVYSRGHFMEFFVFYGPILTFLCLAMWFFYSKEQSGQLKALKKRIQDIMEGDKDFTRKLNIIYFDEVGELAMYMNQFIENIRKTFQDIRSVFGDVQSSGTQIENNSNNSIRIMTEMTTSLSEVNNIVQRQANLVNQSNEILNNVIDSFNSVADNVESQSNNMISTSSVVEEVASNISSVTNSSTKADGLARELNQAALSGNQAVEDSVESITLVENFSNSVQEIITVITNIAEQTDLLAMNAAIEAAHAGDFGKGFAVVADEIRKLAEDSGSSANEIVTHIKQMGKSIKKSVDLSIGAGTSLEKIVNGVQETSDIIQQINNAMGEQNLATQNILNSTAELVESNDKIRKFTDQQKSANQDVIKAMKELVVVTEEVLAIIQNQNNLSQQIIENVENVGNSLERNNRALKNYSTFMEEFKL